MKNTIRLATTLLLAATIIAALTLPLLSTTADDSAEAWRKNVDARLLLAMEMADDDDLIPIRLDREDPGIMDEVDARLAEMFEYSPEHGKGVDDDFIWEMSTWEEDKVNAWIAARHKIMTELYTQYNKTFIEKYIGEIIDATHALAHDGSIRELKLFYKSSPSYAFEAKKSEIMLFAGMPDLDGIIYYYEGDKLVLTTGILTLKGDLNGDGFVNVDDMLVLRDIIFGG